MPTVRTSLKRCYKCKLYKQIKLFSRDKTRKSGLNNRCKLCANEYDKKRHLDPKNKKSLLTNWTKKGYVKSYGKNWEEAQKLVKELKETKKFMKELGL